MPLRSKAQGRFLNWKFGHDWVKEHHFGGSQKSLPKYVHAQGGKSNVALQMFRQKLAAFKRKR
jgi:hypothetical protein